MPQPSYDVFLSHNSHDKPAVRELAQALREHKLSVWLDEDELRPGLSWQELLQEGIEQSRSVAVLIGKDGLGPWEDEEMQGALILAKENDHPVIPVLLPDAPRQPKLPLFLRTRTWVDLRPALSENNLGRLIWGITGEKPGASPVARPATRLDKPEPPPATDNPFDPWNPATPPRFFGREKLLRRLGEALDQGRSVSLVGDWRIGKSSLLHTWAQLAQTRGRTVRQLNGENPEGASCQAFVEAVTGKNYREPHIPDLDAFDLDADFAADELSAWAEAASLPPLILIDEAERPLAHLPHRFFERLRGMLGRVCLVLATRREIGAIPRDDRLTSPLLNRLELQRLGLLEVDGVQGLIGLGDGVLLPEDGARMRDWAGRHPFYLALLGHYLWDARRHGEDMDEAMEEFRENAFARLGELWRTLPAAEQRHFLAASNPSGYAAFASVAGNDALTMTLKRRGLLDDGQLFGRVLGAWLTQRP